MRRMLFYMYDLVILDFGFVVGYYIRTIKDWFKLMGEEMEKKEKLGKWEEDQG